MTTYSYTLYDFARKRGGQWPVNRKNEGKAPGPRATGSPAAVGLEACALTGVGAKTQATGGYEPLRRPGGRSGGCAGAAESHQLLADLPEMPSSIVVLGRLGRRALFALDEVLPGDVGNLWR